MNFLHPIPFFSSSIPALHIYTLTHTHTHTHTHNSRAFHWFTYIMFFHNVVVGITSALLRIFYSIGFGLLLLFRLDRVVLMHGFENFDGGKMLVGNSSVALSDADGETP